MNPSCGQIWKLTNEGWTKNLFIDLPYCLIQGIDKKEGYRCEYLTIASVKDFNVTRSIAMDDFLKWYELVEDAESIKVTLKGIDIHGSKFVFTSPNWLVRMSDE